MKAGAEPRQSRRPRPNTRTRPRRKSKKKKRFRLLRILLRIAAWSAALIIFWCGYLLWHINDFEEPRSISPADTGIVLGAALWNDRPSPGLRERLDHAYRLYEQGKLDHIIVSGGMDYNGSTITEAEGMRNYLIELGVPADKLLLEPLARSTYENLLFSQQMMLEQGWSSATVITHDFHAARATDIAAFLGIESFTVTGAKSRVLSSVKNESREVLAYTKWKLDKMLLRIGLQTPDVTY
ncbi:YdcF family protein [Paenibacillus abyssi]|uniref:DUF218 domain-containing protein n=1 Tax=Paenibacillus abyssi TaxID=1340531 RepID=A0A917CKQ4_9BACL|nr:YdcF family protein [Paenibacillus abyssi]GGF89731.1 hypothetical protein GCM10010916_03790 [Paenibacillus abyssi]